MPTVKNIQRWYNLSCLWTWVTQDKPIYLADHKFKNWKCVWLVFQRKLLLLCNDINHGSFRGSWTDFCIPLNFEELKRRKVSHQLTLTYRTLWNTKRTMVEDADNNDTNETSWLVNLIPQLAESASLSAQIITFDHSKVHQLTGIHMEDSWSCCP